MTRTRSTILALAMLMAATGLAAAKNDKPGADWLTKDQVMQKLTAAGYSNVRGLEADDGHWEGKGTKNGQVLEFHVDPHSGAFTKEAPDK